MTPESLIQGMTELPLCKPLGVWIEPGDLVAYLHSEQQRSEMEESDLQEEVWALEDEIATLLSDQDEYITRITELETELAHYREAYGGVPGTE